jgi:hypothetical protein
VVTSGVTSSGRGLKRRRHRHTAPARGGDGERAGGEAAPASGTFTATAPGGSGSSGGGPVMDASGEVTAMLWRRECARACRSGVQAVDTGCPEGAQGGDGTSLADSERCSGNSLCSGGGGDTRVAFTRAWKRMPSK